METNIQRPRKPKLKIHNIPEDISRDNTDGTLIAQNPHLGIEKGKSFLNSLMRKNALGTY